MRFSESVLKVAIYYAHTHDVYIFNALLFEIATGV